MAYLRLVAAVAVLTLVAACGGDKCGAQCEEDQLAGTESKSSSSASPTASASASPSAMTASGGGRAAASASPSACPTPVPGFDCDGQRRIAEVQQYLAQRPGTVGVILRDRRTGAVWRNQHAGRMVWTASTIKLAMAVDLLVRERTGTVKLTAADRANIRAMLHTSDDNAADAIWRAHGRSEFSARFPTYGVTGATFVNGFPKYWGFMKCTPADLDRLMTYVLDRLPADIRADVLGQMRGVGANQQWGVWGAGPAARPGTKNGWSEEQGGWVMNSVGFAGPDERYTLAMMNSLDGEGAYNEGLATTTRVAALLLAGRS